MKTEGQRKKQ